MLEPGLLQTGEGRVWESMNRGEVQGLRANYWRLTRSQLGVPDMSHKLPDMHAFEAVNRSRGAWLVRDSAEVQEFSANFAAQWDGYLLVPRSGWWTIELASADGAQLWLDGQLLLNDDWSHCHSAGWCHGSHPLRQPNGSLRVVKRTMQLGGSRRSLRVRFVAGADRSGGGAGCVLRWVAPQHHFVKYVPVPLPVRPGQRASISYRLLPVYPTREGTVVPIGALRPSSLADACCDDTCCDRATPPSSSDPRTRCTPEACGCADGYVGPHCTIECGRYGRYDGCTGCVCERGWYGFDCRTRSSVEDD